MRIDSQRQRTCLKHMHVSLGHDGIITASMFYPHKSRLGWSRPASLSSICIDGNIGSFVWSNPVFTKKPHHVFMMSRQSWIRLSHTEKSVQESSIPITFDPEFDQLTATFWWHKSPWYSRELRTARWCEVYLLEHLATRTYATCWRVGKVVGSAFPQKHLG